MHAAGLQDAASVGASIALPAPSPLDRLARQLDAGSHLVHWDGRAPDPAAAAAELLEEALGIRPREPLFAFSAYLMYLRARSERLVVVIEDLDALPPSTAQWLRATLDASGGTMRALARTADDAAAERAAARLGLSLLRPSAPAPQPAIPWLGFGGLALAAALLVVLLLAVPL